MSRSSLARLLLLASLWGSGFLWIKLALRGFSPVQIVLIRLAIGVMVLVPLPALRKAAFPTRRRIWLHLFVAALLANVLPYTLFGYGEQTIASNAAGLLNATTPLWTVVVATIAGIDRGLGARRALAIFLGLAGTVVILAPWQSVGNVATTGALICLAASACYGVSYVYMARYLAGHDVPVVTLTACQLAAGAVLTALILPFAGMTAPTWRTDAVVSMLMLSIFGTGVAYVLNYRLIRDEGPTVASATIYLLPVVAVCLGVAVASEPATVSMIAGTGLVLAGVALVHWSGPSAPPTPAMDIEVGASHPARP